MSKGIMYGLIGLVLAGTATVLSANCYEFGKYNGINQGREEVMGALKDQAQTLYEEAKNSRDLVINERALIESDTLYRAIRDLEKISLEAEEIASQ